MAKKPFDYDEKTLSTCKRCGVSLKSNLVAKKPNAKFCYKCYQIMNPQENVGRGYRKNPASKYYPG